MTPRRTRRENTSERRRPYREPRERVLVVCGGRRTEPDYFKGLLLARRNPSVSVKVVAEPRDPLAVVAHARGYGERSRDDFDVVWCVLDVDQFDYTNVFTAARQAGIELAVSNPCFEVWLLLHHADVTAEINDARRAAVMLSRFVPGYDKTCVRFDDDFAQGVQQAVERGRSLLPDTTMLGSNPSTGVWRLVERISADSAT